MSKYDPLREHLARLDDVVWAAKLGDVEEILGSGLPKSAREHRTWWANSGGSLVHQNAWLDAGWRVERTDLTRDVVVFRRLRIGGTALAGSANGSVPRNDRRSDDEKRLSAIASSLRQPVTVTLRAEWSVLGDVQKVPCSASVLPQGAGVIRAVTLNQGKPSTLVIPTDAVQATYRRLRMAFKGLDGAHDGEQADALLEKLGLDKGAPVECDVVRPGNAWLLTDGRGRKADLDNEQERALVAQLLYVQELQAERRARLISL
ncbi:hypothetical protein JM93_02471 [Roseibium hamelinense]|uniref:DUF7662 domain-containing protein n=1 Tax=Roseibium hamelinense TaxID=150831 RepID=A0A562T0Y1_9HYPH|nr:hypothetical protein [Roseibium hamelinense]MTI44604.1 hypothetical protein [Roseibium hamelinense]TWI87231.1 hypothetical protein JM93_02471 [Roseibium hamelinense]